MSNFPRISGVYADLRQVKSRGVWQVLIEVPSEAAEKLVETFGLPRQDVPTWLAVARLMTSPEALAQATPVVATGSTPAEPKPPVASGETRKEYTLANRVGMTCSDPAFREWLYKRGLVILSSDPRITAENVATYVRSYCGVKSRADILPGTEAATKWHALALEYYEQATGRIAEERR